MSKFTKNAEKIQEDVVRNACYRVVLYCDNEEYNNHKTYLNDINYLNGKIRNRTMALLQTEGALKARLAYYDKNSEKTLQATNDSIVKLSKEKLDLIASGTNEIDKIKKIEDTISKKQKIKYAIENYQIELLSNVMGKCQQQQIIDILRETNPEFFEGVGGTIVDAIVNETISDYKDSVVDILGGKISLPSYKKNQPIPIKSKKFKFDEVDGDIIFTPGLRGGIKFKLHFNKRDKRLYNQKFNLEQKKADGTISEDELLKLDQINSKINKDNRMLPDRVIIDKFMSGEIKPSDSKLVHKVKAKNGGEKKYWEVHFAYKIKSEKTKQRDLNHIIAVDAGLNTALTTYSNKLKEHRFFGDKIFEIVWAERNLFNFKQRNAKYVGVTGKGRKKLHESAKTTSGWSKQTEHMCVQLAKEFCDYVISTDCGVVHLEFLEGLDESVRQSRKTDIMIYRRIQVLIVQRLQRYQIIIKFVDPYHTSQTCNCCKNVDKNARDPKNAKRYTCTNPECELFGETVDADVNAAKNICESTEFVHDIIETRYYKKQSESKKTKK